jgi:hypothetical protein
MPLVRLLEKSNIVYFLEMQRHWIVSHFAECVQTCVKIEPILNKIQALSFFVRDPDLWGVQTKLKPPDTLCVWPPE